MKTQAVHNKNNKPAEFLIKGPWWDNSVKWGALAASQAAPATTPHQLLHHRRREKGKDSGKSLACFSRAMHTSVFTEEERWQEDTVWLHGATRGYGLSHVNVGSKTAVGFIALTQNFSVCFVYVWVYLCVWVVCVHVCVSSLMQNGRGIPNHPVFHPVLTFSWHFCHLSLPPTFFFWPSGFSEQTFDRSTQTPQS